ncbi:uncharacterized protein JCM15063_002401 [Sporobolomyces koalae]|uniref:uncharacterized protein n=1 Tax=Sporobolomyces koalae TaxID=500713 RepID=UPI0031719817
MSGRLRTIILSDSSEEESASQVPIKKSLKRRFVISSSSSSSASEDNSAINSNGNSDNDGDRATPDEPSSEEENDNEIDEAEAAKGWKLLSESQKDITRQANKRVQNPKGYTTEGDRDYVVLQGDPKGLRGHDAVGSRSFSSPFTSLQRSKD